jgi:hypothetical protein
MRSSLRCGLTSRQMVHFGIADATKKLGSEVSLLGKRPADNALTSQSGRGSGKDSNALDQWAYVSEELAQKQIWAVHHDEVVAPFEAHKPFVGR